MNTEPLTKRAAVFVDGQNLFHAARKQFDHREPDYDVLALSRLITGRCGWTHLATHFYTGMPDPSRAPRWHQYWARKLSEMHFRGVHVVSRPLVYRTQATRLPDGTLAEVVVGQEKGIDVRIALDVVRLARENAYDVAVLFSQDQDLREVATEIRAIARSQGRWIKIASAFPVSASARFARGVDRTDWLPISREEYERCCERGRG